LKNIIAIIIIFVCALAIWAQQSSSGSSGSSSSTQPQRRSFTEQRNLMEEQRLKEQQRLRDEEELKARSKGQTTLNTFPREEEQRLKAEAIKKIELDSILMIWALDSLRLVDSLRIMFGDTTIKTEIDTLDTLIFDELLIEEKKFERLDGNLSELKIFGEDFFYMASEMMLVPNIGPVNSDYRLGIGDELIIQIWGDVQSTESLIIGRNGTVSPTGIGQQRVAGLSVSEAKKLLIQRFSKVYSGVRNGASNATTFVDVNTGNLRQKSVIVVGEVAKPGSYLIPSTAGVVSAIAKAGGPTNTATMRNVVIRRSGSEKIDTVDLYGYFLTGKINDSISLSDFDVILVNPVGKRVMVDGAVRRPAQYELKDGETFEDLFKFCGGILPEAHARNILVERTNPGVDRQSYTIKEEDFSRAFPQKNDYVFIDFVDMFKNTVSIEGAIKRPGVWAFEEGMKISDIIDLAGGVLEEFFGDRIIVSRTHDDLSREMFSSNLKDILDGSPQADRKLQKWDVVKVSSIWDLRQRNFVDVYGQVKKPGKYFFREGMTIQDVILLAGGFTEMAYKDTVEISRIIDSDLRKGNKIVYERINISEDFFKLNTNKLQHMDVVFVREDSKKKPQEIVYLGGEFLFPGNYAKVSENETVKDLIVRAGGFKTSAYLDGITFKRSKDSIGQIGINFYELFEKNKSRENIILEHGDTIIATTIPKTVVINGSVNSPTATKYVEGKNVGHYINRAGGLTLLGKRGIVYVIRANGETRQVSLSDKKSVNAGSQVFAVDGPPPRERNPQLVLAALSALTSMAAASVTMINSLK